MADVVLGAVGATAGFMIGGPAGASIGWAVGSTIGSAYQTSRQVIRGPSIGDAQKQLATEGAPIPIVFGRSPPIQGTVVADSEPVITKTKKRTGGKGSPKVETEEAFRTYAIMVCEGPATLLQAWRDGKLVYDAESESGSAESDGGAPDMTEENEKFWEYARWLDGNYGQMPHPDLEEIYGVGNTPAFRGRAVLLLSGEDVTDKRGARSQWHVRVFRGAGASYTTPPYPALTMDAIGVSSRALDPFVWQPPMDEIGVESFALDGVHRDLIAKYENYPPESIDVASHAIDGVHRPLIARYENYPPEEIDIESNALDGVHKLVLIQYLNYEPESIDVSSHALDGTHGPA